MIISRTPLRISLLGGGTDFPSYYREHGGLCLSATIDKYVYVIVKERHDDSIRISYTQTEIVDSLDDLQHDLIREALRMAGVKGGVEIITIADVPGRGSGLASSSAVTVGTLHALAEYGGWGVGHLKGLKFHLQQRAIEIECDILKQTPGHQDQIAVAYGGLNLIEFEENEATVQSVLYDLGFPPGRWQTNLLLFAIPTKGHQRDGRAILSDQDERTNVNIETLAAMKGLVKQTLTSCLEEGDFDKLGELLHEAWQLKRSLSPHIATPIIDEMYAAGREAGALGGKVCGAGGGGYMLFYCPDGTHEVVRTAMTDYGPELEFNFEWEGSVCQRTY